MSEDVALVDANLREIARLRAELGQAEQRYARLARWHTRAVVALSGEAAVWEYRALAAEQAATGWRRAGQRLAAAWRAERTTSHALASALRGLLAAPYGCPMCDAGRLRNPEKTHWPECPYAIARAVLGEDG